MTDSSLLTHVPPRQESTVHRQRSCPAPRNTGIRSWWAALLVVGSSLATAADSVAPAPFEPSWASLQRYECPEWFRDAKFGIWAHWGPQSVPEMGDWYGRFLYNPPEPDNEWRRKGGAKAGPYHREHYGHPAEFGYKDLIPLFKAERWKPEELMALYRKAGARYFMSMGQHHDNFDLWNSKHQPWNAVNMGPKRDIVGDWQAAAKKEGLRFGVSLHGSSSWSWWEPSRGADVDGPKKGVPYDGFLTKQDGVGKWWEGYDPQDLYCRPHQPGEPRDAAYMTKFVNRVFDLVDNYQPDMLYFDGGLPFDRLDIASDFYNRTQARLGRNEATVAIKGVPPERRKAVIYDIENGQAEEILPHPWQTDTSFDGWFISKDAYRTSTKKILQQLADIVSKNGNLMLNITQRSDGTIMDYSVRFLEEMAAWMAVNGEAIHGTRPWTIFGEGPVKVVGGETKKSQRLNYTGEDVRYTTKGKALYALLMEWPGDTATLRSLTPERVKALGGITSIRLLGQDAPLTFIANATGVTVHLPAKPAKPLVPVLRINGD